MRKPYKTFVAKPEGERPLGSSRVDRRIILR
jgi:hypothetical protein